jgi:hypothetical protein
MAKRPYTIDPDVARERAAKAGKASQSIDSYIRRLVARAPELTPQQRRDLAALLTPSGSPPRSRRCRCSTSRHVGARSGVRHRRVR